jgi:hypothetical protein
MTGGGEGGAEDPEHGEALDQTTKITKMAEAIASDVASTVRSCASW